MRRRTKICYPIRKKVLKSIFPAEKWIKNIEIPINEQIIEKQITEIDIDVEKNIVDDSPYVVPGTAYMHENSSARRPEEFVAQDQR